MGHGWVKRLFIDRDYRHGEDGEDYVFIPSTVYPSVSSASSAILEYLRKHPESSVDEISAGTGLTAGEITSALIGLELLRKIRKNGLLYSRIR